MADTQKKVAEAIEDYTEIFFDVDDTLVYFPENLKDSHLSKGMPGFYKHYQSLQAGDSPIFLTARNCGCIQVLINNSINKYYDFLEQGPKEDIRAKADMFFNFIKNMLTLSIQKEFGGGPVWTTMDLIPTEEEKTQNPGDYYNNVIQPFEEKILEKIDAFLNDKSFDTTSYKNAYELVDHIFKTTIDGELKTAIMKENDLIAKYEAKIDEQESDPVIRNELKKLKKSDLLKKYSAANPSVKLIFDDRPEHIMDLKALNTDNSFGRNVVAIPAEKEKSTRKYCNELLDSIKILLMRISAQSRNNRADAKKVSDEIIEIITQHKFYNKPISLETLDSFNTQLGNSDFKAFFEYFKLVASISNFVMEEELSEKAKVSLEEKAELSALRTPPAKNKPSTPSTPTPITPAKLLSRASTIFSPVKDATSNLFSEGNGSPSDSFLERAFSQMRTPKKPTPTASKSKYTTLADAIAESSSSSGDEKRHSRSPRNSG